VIITLVFPVGLTRWTPDCPWLPRGTHPVYTPNQSGLCNVDTTKAPFDQLLAAGFTIYPYTFSPTA
jgi:hypothetical protein